MKIIFISSRNFIEKSDMRTKSDNVEIMMGDDNDEVIKNLFDTLLKRYQEGLLTSVKGSEFVFDHVELLNYIFHKVNLIRSGTYIKTPEWIIISLLH